MEKIVLVPVSNGTEDMEAVIIVDMLRRANFHVIVAGDSNIITCANGIKLIPDTLLNDIDERKIFDAIIIPGGLNGVMKLAQNTYLGNILQSHSDLHCIIGAICAAPLVLAEHNILKDNAKITCHPTIKDKLSRFITVDDNIPVFQEGHIVTSRGAGTAFDFCFKIIELLCSKDKAETIFQDIVYEKK